ncbi:Transposase, partial [Dyadobacter soli]
SHLSIDETSLSHGELYTILTNKSAKGGKGCIVAIVAGTKAETVIEVLRKIPESLRKKVAEITLDMAGSMTMIAKRCFPRAVRVTDRFHVQRLAVEALQEIRIKHRWEALDQENDAIEQHEPGVYLFTRLMYFAFIRPGEILNLQFSHIHLREAYITVHGLISKNGKTATAQIIPALANELEGRLVFQKPEYYLFSTGIQPASIHFRSRNHSGVMKRLWSNWDC